MTNILIIYGKKTILKKKTFSEIKILIKKQKDFF